jgi:hypothetical protein
MNFADIENMWRSPQNRPNPAQLEEVKMKFVADLRRRHRGNSIFLVVVFIPLACFTAKIVRHLLWPDPALDRIDLSREWAVIPLFLIPWTGWFLLTRLHRQHRERHANYDRSISATVSALLDENRSERLRCKVIAGLMLASVVVVPLIVQQLRAVGKAGDEILLPGLVIFPAYAIVTLAWSAFRYHRKLLPRKRELEALLASYV